MSFVIFALILGSIVALKIVFQSRFLVFTSQSEIPKTNIKISRPYNLYVHASRFNFSKATVIPVPKSDNPGGLAINSGLNIDGFRRVKLTLTNKEQPNFPVYFNDDNDIIRQSVGYYYDKNKKELEIKLYISSKDLQEELEAGKALLEQRINHGFLQALYFASFQTSQEDSYFLLFDEKFGSSLYLEKQLFIKLL